MANATGSVLIENERLTATLWSFGPGDDTGRPRVVLPGGGEAVSDLTLASPYFRNAGVGHKIVNANDFDFAFIERELG